MRQIRRRTLLTAGSAAVTAAAAGFWLRERDPAMVVPTAAAGEERVTRHRSAARGRDVDLYDNVRALESALPTRPAAGSYTDGNHNFNYWSTAAPAAFDFLAATLNAA